MGIPAVVFLLDKAINPHSVVAKTMSVVAKTMSVVA